MRNRGWMILPLSLLIAVCCSCAPGVYTRYNLHYIAQDGVNKASYANWTSSVGHGFLPYNSRVLAYPSHNRIRFVTDTRVSVLMEYNAPRMGMSSSEYVRLITSVDPVAYDNLSEVDLQGVRAGKALVGMSKDGVKIALGYPATHRTASLAENRWTYWKNRHDMIAVEFDNSGKVVRIVD